MIELFYLVQTALAATAVGIAVVAAPAAIISGQDIPDLTPMLDNLSETSDMVKKYE